MLTLLADQFVPVLFNVKRDLSEIEYLKHSTTFENVSNKSFITMILHLIGYMLMLTIDIVMHELK